MWLRPRGQQDHCLSEASVGTSFSFFFFLPFLKNYLFLAVLGLHCCAGLSLVVANGGGTLVAVQGFLLLRSMGSRACWISSCGTRA